MEEGSRPVLDALFEFAEEGDFLFDEDIVTDYPRKLAIADSIREKYLAKMHQEVPHEMGILVKEISEGRNRWDVKVDVVVNRISQKPIVIGRGAETVKYVRKCSERELSDMFGVKVALEIWVRVEPNWMKNKKLLTEMGYLGQEI
jgi:GTP-binding protein Era